MTEIHTHEDNLLLNSKFDFNALQMALVSERNNLANANINTGFYAHKISEGKELDMAEVADKEYWEVNTIKINEKIAFIEMQLSSTI
jgi:hypothetical protein